MKKPVVDYKEFRLSRINEPRFAHSKLLLGWVVYFALYFITENLIPFSRCTPIHCKLDDLMPFCEYFAIFYIFWYVLVFSSIAFYFFYDVESFKKLQIFIMITQGIAMFFYILLPSRQDLRPDLVATGEVTRNIFTRAMAFIYSFDTPTGVCPSLHVAYSVGIFSVTAKRKSTPLIFKIFVAVMVVMISLATAYVKQHSMVDVFAALPVCLVAEIALYGKGYWLPKFKKH